MRTLSIETPTHGRVLVRDTADAVGTLVAFHGYGQTAERMAEDLANVPGIDRWQLVSVQALHRFYGRDSQTIMASWMTRQDRDDAIADNVEYVNNVIDRTSSRDSRRIFLGYSQGVAMAYRAALLGRHEAAGIIALAGDVPPEFKAHVPRPWPRVLIVVGSTDVWYTDTKVLADEAALRAQGAPLEIVRFTGGHEWGRDMIDAIDRELASLSQNS